MKQAVSVAVFLVLTMLLGCSPGAPTTLPLSKETPLPAATDAPVSFSSSEAQNTPTSTPSPMQQESQTPVSSPTPPAPATTPVGTTSITPLMTPAPAQTRPLPALDAFMKGIHFNDWKPFDGPRYSLFPTPQTDQSLKNLAATGAGWISITVVFGQETIASTTMFSNSPATSTDAELLRVINLAHSLGLRVMLFPSLALSNDPNHWWGQIGTAFANETQWQDWFASYTESINHYASFAQQAGVDMLSIGRELGGVTHREADWRQRFRKCAGDLGTYHLFQP
jgi:hypothetical protein